MSGSRRKDFGRHAYPAPRDGSYVSEEEGSSMSGSLSEHEEEGEAVIGIERTTRKRRRRRRSPRRRDRDEWVRKTRPWERYLRLVWLALGLLAVTTVAIVVVPLYLHDSDACDGPSETHNHHHSES